MDSVFITRRIPQKGLDLLEDVVEKTIWPGDLPPSKEQMIEAVREVDGLLCLLTDPVDAEVIAAAPKLRVISNYAVGFDNIDISEAVRRGIPVGNTPGVLTETTADFAFALLCAAARRVVEADRFVRVGKWQTWGPRLLLGADLWGATLGIVGFGRIGQALARRAQGFQMKVLFTDPAEVQILPDQPGVLRQVDLDTLLQESDFVSLHTPLTEQTHHLMNQERFALMKPTAVLVNTARGAVVDSHALYHALLDGTIAAAALDVTEPEPMPGDFPLLLLDNLIVTPHIASASVTARNRMAVIAAENLLAGLKGERLPFCANPQVYDQV
ncbi:MAG: D-glycerate dehydrogenase [Anaerolineales bacterium]|nr:D-glycerate dehydrogenase [Anaerolineales bacterium]